MTDVPFADQLRIQAEVLAPLLTAMREELGKDAADRLMRKGLQPYARRIGREMRAGSDEPSLVKLGKAVEGLEMMGEQKVAFHERAPDRLSYDIVECSVAKFYRAMGLGDLGFTLICCLDYDIMPSLDERIVMERSQTIMQGASHCDFRFRIEGPDLPSQ